MRKPVFSICENKYTDQLSGNNAADQRLYFRYIDSTILLLSISWFQTDVLPICQLSVGVRPGWKPGRQDFLRHGSNVKDTYSPHLFLLVNMII